MPYTCDTCGRQYSNKRNLCRHVKEKHNDGLLHFKCVVAGCKSTFIRRGYLKKHLNIIHKMDKADAQKFVSEVILQPEQPARAPLYEPISSEDDDAAGGEFVHWLDDIIQSDVASPEPITVSDSGETQMDGPDEISLNDFYNRASAELQRTRRIDADNATDVTDVVIPGDDDEASNATSSDINVTDVIDDAVSDVISICASDAASHVSDKNDVIDAEGPVSCDSDADVRIDDTTDQGDDQADPADQADDEADHADEDPVYNADDDGEETEQIEFINVTLRTCTKFRNGVPDRVDRVVSLAYSDSFNPDSVDPLQVFRRVQEEFMYYVNEHNKHS